MTDFYFRHKKEICRIAVFFLTAAVGLLLVAQIAAFAAAQIFNYAVEKQHMLKGTITAEKISADIAGYVLFKNLQWNDEANRPILFVPEVRMKVRPWDILRGKLRATAISDIKLKDASFALYFDKNMNVDLIARPEKKTNEPAGQKLTLDDHIKNFTRNGNKMKFQLHLDNCRMEAFYDTRHFILSHVNLHASVDTEKSLFLDFRSGSFGGTAVGDGMSLYGDIDMTSPEHEVNVNAVFSGIDPSSLGFGESIRDKMDLTATATGPLKRPLALGHLSMKTLSIPALDFTQVEGNVRYRGGRFDFTNVTGRVYGGRLEAYGNYHIDTRAYDIYVKGFDLDARYPAKSIRMSCYVNLDGEIHCDGNSKKAISSGTFSSGSGHYKLIPFRKISGAFHNKGKALDFYNVSIETKAGTFTTDAFHITNGKVTLGPIDFTGDSHSATDILPRVKGVKDTVQNIKRNIGEIKEHIHDLKNYKESS